MKQDTDCIAWGGEILTARKLDGWTIQWTPSLHTEGLALFDSKQLLIYWPDGQPDYPLMLHEIAHAVVGRGGHDSEFAHQYMYLVEEYFEPKGGQMEDKEE